MIITEEVVKTRDRILNIKLDTETEMANFLVAKQPIDSEGNDIETLLSEMRIVNVLVSKSDIGEDKFLALYQILAEGYEAKVSTPVEEEA